MNKQTKRFGSILWALVLCAALTVPALAEAPRVVTQYDNAQELFSKSLQGKETLVRESNSLRITGNGKIELDTSKVRDNYQKRAASTSITVADDAVVADIFEIRIPKGETLTVEEGAKLTVYGVLVIEGKLVNNGTVVIGYKDKAVDTDKTATIHNRGRITNVGALNIRCGELINDTSGKLQNKGSIDIANKIGDYRALQVLARQTGEALKAGEITNSGVITVNNTKGTGIYVQQNAVLQNDGEIVQSRSGSVEGKVKGNAVG